MSRKRKLTEEEVKHIDDCMECLAESITLSYIKYRLVEIKRLYPKFPEDERERNIIKQDIFADSIKAVVDGLFNLVNVFVDGFEDVNEEEQT